MSRPKFCLQPSENGFTIVELVIVLVLIGIVTTALYSFFNNSTAQYFGLQTDSTAFTDLASQSQRLANVLRGLTDVVTPNSNDITVYAYFSPNNTYVSLIRYYLGNSNKILYADVTPMTANPPIGTPITTNKRTFVVIDNFSQISGVNLFNYLDSAGNILAMPITDEHLIKGIQINLSVPSPAPSPTAKQSMSLNVSLRNRKTNL